VKVFPLQVALQVMFPLQVAATMTSLELMVWPWKHL